MRTLKDLFEHQLKNLYSAETQLLEVLPIMAKMAHSQNLKTFFEAHEEETREHRNRIEAISRELNISHEGISCKAMSGLINEVKNFIRRAESEEVMDAGLIAEAQSIEHYEISGYGTVVRYAKELGHRIFAEQLQKTLNEVYDADNTMGKIAENRLNIKAIINI